MEYSITPSLATYLGTPIQLLLNTNGKSPSHMAVTLREDGLLSFEANMREKNWICDTEIKEMQH